MYYGEIKKNDIANGPGVRVSLFVSGCRRHCKNCFNSATWDFEYGSPFTRETEDEIISALAPEHISGLTVLGGEPFEKENQRALLPFLKRVRDAFPQKTVWLFSGSTLDGELSVGGINHCEATCEILSLADVLVDGAFIEELHDITLRFRGSSNQRLIDLNKTRECGEIVLWDN